MRPLILLLTATITLLSMNTVEAGGFYFRRSYYPVKYIYRDRYIQPSNYSSPNSITINNIGPPSLIQSGQTAFGYGNDTNFEFGAFNPLDLNIVANIQGRIADQAQDNISALITAGTSAEASEAINNIAKAAAIGQLTNLVSELGIDTNAPARNNVSLQFRNGQWRVVQTGAGQQGNGDNGGNSNDNGNAGRTSVANILNDRCLNCHSGNADQGGGLVLSETILRQDSKLALKALDQVAQDKMPKNNPLSGDEKATFLSELLTITRE